MIMNEDTEKRLQQIFSYYKTQPQEQELMLQMLREIQDITGQLSTSILDRAASEINIKRSVLSCLVKYAKDLKPCAYDHKIVACTGPRCARKDSMELLRILKEELKPDKDGISRDGQILLTTRCCLKHCKTAPNLMIDDELVPHVTKEQLPELLRKLRSPS